MSAISLRVFIWMQLPIATKRQVYETFVEQLGEEVAWMHKDPEFQDRLRRVKVADAGTAKLLQEVNGAEDAATPIDIVTFQAKLAARWSQSENESVRSEALANAAFLIACGWRFDRKDGKDLHMLRCEACNRRWQVSPTSAKVDDGDSEHSEPPTKRLKTAEARPVDLLSQHRHFCPWVAERKSTGVDDYGEIDPKLWEFVKLPGWKQYAQVSFCFGSCTGVVGCLLPHLIARLDYVGTGSSRQSRRERYCCCGLQRPNAHEIQ